MISNDPFRTAIEAVLLDEMMHEDAKYYVLGDADDIPMDAEIPDIEGGGIFDGTVSSEDDMYEDDEIDYLESEDEF